jgi:hypothetical protein
MAAIVSFIHQAKDRRRTEEEELPYFLSPDGRIIILC